MWPAWHRTPDAHERPQSKTQTTTAPKDKEKGPSSHRTCSNVSSKQMVRTRNGWLTLPAVWTVEGWLYVAVVIDLFSRRVVGWSMKDAMTAQMVTDALMMAIWRRGRPRELLHHSDQGSQYTSEPFQRLMADNGVTCSPLGSMLCMRLPGSE